MDDIDDSYKPKFTRSRTGCLRCRKGKHKCDEEQPICRRCRNVSKECVYPPPPVPKSTVRATKKRRIRREQEDVEEIVRRDDDRIDDGAISLNRSGSSDGMLPFFLTPSDYLTLSFPDAQERDLMRHLLRFGNVVMYSVPVQNEPIQFLHLARCLQHSRGFSLESDALLLSLISIAAGHKSSLIAQQEKKYSDKYPAIRWDVLAETNSQTESHQISSASQSAQRLISDHFSTTSLSICQTAVAFRESGNGLTAEMSNLLLTSALAIIIAQCLNAGTMWKQAFETACDLIDLRGGPSHMLEQAMLISQAEVVRIRLLLENFVVVDVCQCLATGSAPRLMKEPFASWWYDYVTNDADTVHNSYGVDRAVVEVANRVNMLVHESSILGSVLDEGYLDTHNQKIQNVLQELYIWETSFSQQVGRNLRVVYGNRVMVNMLKVVVYVDLLKKRHADCEVQESAWAALTAFEEGKQLDHGVGLLLAAIITGSVLQDEEKRAQARGVITRLRATADYAYDVDEAAAMLDKVYRLRDEGMVDPSWRVVTNSGLLVF
ncbi:uncharacterized protein I206_107332 [Kwoniella pini CBS 10737]|uniref:Zn(2)-C6 fungal-type domain-containing protein n=1 Tax=Kwoniella pini CBS 10737 TaxID=1296096 RepID=A0A1B9HYJ9_9TREE|nr:uncharacterized protein I206_05124 [Kwoniella pini CBS 10737]OCF48347.1 hypothetical protein I206_05124 [Kwoniella pini CBS 10737]